MSVRTSQSHPIRVDWAPDPAPRERLGMTLAPGKKQQFAQSGSWHRDLADDLRRLRDDYHTQLLVSLIEDQELDSLEIPELVAEATAAGIEVIRFPIRDQSIPSSLTETRKLVARIVSELRRDRTVVVHCMGGLGRTGLIAACVLIALGMKSADAVLAVRAARANTIETRPQLDYVRGFTMTDPISTS